MAPSVIVCTIIIGAPRGVEFRTHRQASLCVAVEAGFSSCRQLMADPLTADWAGLLSLASPGDSRTTVVCRE